MCARACCAALLLALSTVHILPRLRVGSSPRRRFVQLLGAGSRRWRDSAEGTPQHAGHGSHCVALDSNLFIGFKT